MNALLQKIKIVNSSAIFVNTDICHCYNHCGYKRAMARGLVSKARLSGWRIDVEIKIWLDDYCNNVAIAWSDFVISFPKHHLSLAFRSKWCDSYKYLLVNILIICSRSSNQNTLLKTMYDMKMFKTYFTGFGENRPIATILGEIAHTAPDVW